MIWLQPGFIQCVVVGPEWFGQKRSMPERPTARGARPLSGLRVLLIASCMAQLHGKEESEA